VGRLWKFQFQYGLIVIEAKLKSLDESRVFQFQYGLIVMHFESDAIRSWQVSIPIWSDCDLYVELNQAIMPVFQFQYGLIVITILRPVSWFRPAFQFQYGLIVIY
jgi:hypothetical protein